MFHWNQANHLISLYFLMMNMNQVQLRIMNMSLKMGV